MTNKLKISLVAVIVLCLTIMVSGCGHDDDPRLSDPALADFFVNSKGEIYDYFYNYNGYIHQRAFYSSRNMALAASSFWNKLVLPCSL